MSGFGLLVLTNEPPWSLFSTIPNFGSVYVSIKLYLDTCIFKSISLLHDLFIHLFFSNCFLVRIVVDLELVLGTLGMRQEYTWMGRQSITEHHAHTEAL